MSVSVTALVPAATQLLTAPSLGDADRALWVKTRIVSISKEVSSRAIEAGLLLKEIKDNAYYTEWDYESFDAAIEGLHSAGLIEYGWRAARNFIAVVEMMQSLGVPLESIEKISISKLREICTIPDEAKQRELLGQCDELDVKEVQAIAKKLRAKAKGHDVDPLTPVTLMLTSTMREFFNTCIQRARVVYGDDDNVSPSVILVDRILPEWFNGTAVEGEEADGE